MLDNGRQLAFTGYVRTHSVKVIGRMAGEFDSKIRVLKSQRKLEIVKAERRRHVYQWNQSRPGGDQ